MSGAASSIQILKALLDVGFIVLGVCLLVQIISIPEPPLWLSTIFAIVGLTILEPSGPKLQISFGFLFLGLGAFTMLRTIDIITEPWLQYGLGSLLILVGVVQIIYSVRGGTPQNTSPRTPKL